MQSNKIILISGITIGVMVLIAIILVVALSGDKPVSMLPENTPEGTVQRFFIALQEEDYNKAYTFITPPPDNKVPYDTWRMSYYRSSEKSVWKATIGNAKILEEDATVEVIIDIFRPHGPFSEPVNTNRMNFSLKKAGSGWTIVSPVDLWWLY